MFLRVVLASATWRGGARGFYKFVHLCGMVCCVQMRGSRVGYMKIFVGYAGCFASKIVTIHKHKKHDYGACIRYQICIHGGLM